MKNIIIVIENNLIKNKGFEDGWTPKVNDNQQKIIKEVDENNLPFWVTAKKSEIEWDNDNQEVIPIKPENKIIQIRNLAREKFIELKNDLDKAEKRKIQLTDINDWTDDDESKLLQVTTGYDQAITDYNSIKQLLVDNVANLDSIMPQVKETLNKYNINI